ncbi:leucyl aminopeptidase family protein [Streptomyces sp. NPDC058620]|uniref:leucyl aminopeptidase family protein n=1 Tax=Streptomyces sp. NPDC058620 TaxID=3346560 RepID=UPI00365E1CBD
MSRRTAFDPIPSWISRPDVSVVGEPDGTGVGAGALGMPLAEGGERAEAGGLSVRALGAAGLTGKARQALTVPREDGPPLVVYGIGPASAVDCNVLRHAGASFAAAAAGHARLALVAPEVPLGMEEVVQALVEGVLLARYSFDPLRREPGSTPLQALVIVVPPEAREGAERGAVKGAELARATLLARDLATSPPSLFNAEAMAITARLLGAQCGLGVEVFGPQELRALGCGGLLGVNAGSTDEPRMIKLTYVPDRAAGSAPRLALVGKGIMYDSGGISLKPSDSVHATMKNDMSGAGAILGAMSVLRALDCPTAVTGYLMCTDNMPSGSATKLGDVLTMRSGMTVEVLNTDAEGRLVMADALALAAEETPDAIVDIATLTGACLRALGPEMAGVFGNTQPLVDQVLHAAREVDEPAWQLPQSSRYRPDLDSDVADIANMGGANAAAIHASLFLEEFVAGLPWAHIDIAGPAQSDTASSWRNKGCTGFGARLLTRLALDFEPPAKDATSTSDHGVSEVTSS